MNKILYTAFLLLLAQYGNAQCLYTENCPTDTVEVCDLSPNDADLWNATYWLDPVTNLQDLPDGAVSLSFTATDSCPGAVLQFRYVLELDLDGNGTPETQIDSDDLPAAGTVLFGNFSGPGEARNFDQRPVPADQQYAFALEVSGTDTTKTARVRWNTALNPGAYFDPQLPYGVHRITWTVTDGLGGISACTVVFEIKDCKKPTVVCLNGLSVNIMPTGMITLWASDFLQYTEDNYTPSNQIQIGIVKSAESAGVFPEDGNGNPVNSVTFDCEEVGKDILVQLWARDKAGYTDFCTVATSIYDSGNFCPLSSPYDSTCISTWCDGTPFIHATVEISISPLIITLENDSSVYASSCYIYSEQDFFHAIYTVVPSYDTDPMNGVSVIDILRISQHILGISPLPSPYAMIAADVNKSGSITSFDIVEIRKLLTGTYTEFPNNTSWRFIDADHTFPNPANPFSAILPESISIPPAQDTFNLSHFYAIKVGDVDCSAMPGLTAAPEDRRVTSMQLPDRVLQAGETADLPLRLDQAGRCLGFQFGLTFDPEALEIVSVSAPGLPEWAADCWAVPAPGRLNVVWASTQRISGPDILTVRVKARAQVRLSDAVQLAETGLPALHCDDQMNAGGLYLEFRDSRPGNNEASAIGAARPNPTAAGFSVPVRLDEPGPVTLRLYNALGVLVYEMREFLPAGVHELEVPAERMPANGLYRYELRAGNDTAVGTVARNAK